LGYFVGPVFLDKDLRVYIYACGVEEAFGHFYLLIDAFLYGNKMVAKMAVTNKFVVRLLGPVLFRIILLVTFANLENTLST
jgi:hypothetical protein